MAGKRAWAPILAQTWIRQQQISCSKELCESCKHLIMERGCLHAALIPSLIAGLSGSQPASSQLKMLQEMCGRRTAVLSFGPEVSLHHLSLVIRAMISISLISISLTSFSCHRILYSEVCSENRRTLTAFQGLSKLVFISEVLQQTGTIPRQKKLTDAVTGMSSAAK